MEVIYLIIALVGMSMGVIGLFLAIQLTRDILDGFEDAVALGTGGLLAMVLISAVGFSAFWLAMEEYKGKGLYECKGIELPKELNYGIKKGP